ncbi:glycoside hydrolase family 11 protein [Xiashengella succiniciproducens]|uniref:Endo-1,4-beta-xylanase n=1 Tax=Xiashengella succiniciproducens TaxID=2949635 RepID=A0A9J6ZNC2_9BACT|nr:glycoside hydrolase family 11 protein [Alkaliflexus sp. Ai-910]URW79213.1 glycoside hydrolase family 11 protein [Alkaliflexus sp. Ai-910]
MRIFGILVLVSAITAGCGSNANSGSNEPEKAVTTVTYCSDPDNEQHKGIRDGYSFELWNQYGKGDACMTLGEGALFKGHWSGIENYLARRGYSYDNTKHHNEIGRFSSKYNCIYEPGTESGNSYLSIYGWTVDPLIEFYIVEDWRRWIPSMAEGTENMGSFEVDGSIYDVYVSLRENQPSIQGQQTFKQYFSIRRDVRNKGNIDISAHFDFWESLGMELGKFYEVTFVVEGYRSNGTFEFTELEINVE